MYKPPPRDALGLLVLMVIAVGWFVSWCVRKALETLIDEGA